MNAAALLPLVIGWAGITLALAIELNWRARSARTQPLKLWALTCLPLLAAVVAAQFWG